MRNTLRVMHGNFALETALHLSQRLTIPVVTLCLVPSAIVYPTCHASNVDDAYARWSFADIHQQFQRVGLPFIGVTGKSSRKRLRYQDDRNDEGFALFKLLDIFSPHAVVTDNAFDVHAMRDLDQLSQFLHATPTSSPWALVAIDSSSCIPICSKSDKVQSTLRSRGEQYLHEDDFGREYAKYSQNDFQPYAFTAIGKVPAKLAVSESDCVDRVQLALLLRDLRLEQVDWSIIESMNTQNSPEMAPFSEMDALQKLDRLLTGFSDRPAIQAELQGGGVMSLLPYIRHGTLFSGHVIRQISAAISSQPPPRTAQARKALAALKKPDSESALLAPAYGSFAKCFALDWLHAFSASSSALDAYSVVLPTWINNDTKFGAGTTSGQKNDPDLGAAIYDPYELESARTNDLYWNDIQKFLTEHRYIHPLLIVYWSYRILQWSVSSRAAIAMIESLLHKNALGASSSPDAIFGVWNQLFRLGTPALMSENEDTVSTFQRLMDQEVSSQPRLQLHF
uniref:Photolyase/cryptochrome alpha/beta domain-containing protein n=1 Tax=Globisporangium ultimum (strain ATCC 200006 / CBS 805.95 / DAOM BR144) TaxID=431595 RepID=K3X2Y3_GLOUD